MRHITDTTLHCADMLASQEGIPANLRKFYREQLESLQKRSEAQRKPMRDNPADRFARMLEKEGA